MVADTPLRVDKIDRRPVPVVERPPDGVLAVDRHRVVDAQVLDRVANVVDVLLEFELGRVHADHDEALALVFLGPGAHVRQRAQPVDTRIRPEVDEDDLAAQACSGKRRRVEPTARPIQRGHLAFDRQRRRERDLAVLRGGSARQADAAGEQSGQHALGRVHDAVGARLDLAGTSPRLSRDAIRTRSQIESAFILRIILPRWALTVISLMPSSLAHLLVEPARDDERHHLAFPRAQQGIAVAQRPGFVPRRPAPRSSGRWRCRSRRRSRRRRRAW